MAQLHFQIENQWISRTDHFKVVGKSKNYLYAEFDFMTDEWSGTATALFHSELLDKPKDVIIGQDGTCQVPWEVIDTEEDGEFFVSVFCGDLVTANKSRVHVHESGYSDDSESSEPPTPSVYAQIIDRMDGIEQEVEDATERTEAAAEKAEEAVSHYPRIIDDYWYVWDVESEEFVNTEIKAEAEDGTSAIVQVQPIPNGHRVIITDVSGEHVFDVPDGYDGKGIVSVSKTGSSGDVDTYTMTFTTGDPFVYYVTNGSSATISSYNITNGHRLVITDKNGTRNIDVMNGAKGDTGTGIYSIDKTGEYQNVDYYTITYTNGNKTTFYVTNGYSPTVNVETISGGHRVVINDINGSHVFYVMDGTAGGTSIHICTSSEYDHTTRVPTISNPQENVFYLVPAESEESHDMFVEWIYTNNAWEMFGGASVDLSDYATKTELSGKVDKVTGKGLSTNDYTINEKTKLANIEAQANKTAVDDELSTTSTNPVQNKVITGELNDVKADLSELQETVDGILVEQTIGETVTLTNRNNAYDFYYASSGWGSNGFNARSYNDGIVSVINNGGDSEKSPYIYQITNFGSSTWLVGFKFKFTKLNESLADPEQFRIHMGASTITDYTPVWGEWVEYANIATIDLTRIRIAARNFSSVPLSDSFKLEIKDLYVYDVSNVSADLRALIIEQQNANYQDGTVTYGEQITTTSPDTSLSIDGKAADSKAVGDALKSLNGIRNVKDYGITGDGTTDDTGAINALFALGGTFYFPSGTYRITGTIELPENAVMYGDGDATVIDMHDCVNLTECTFRGSDKVYPYILARHDGISIRNIKLIGNNSLKQQRHAGIGILDAENCSVENVTIYNINYDPTQDNDATVSGYGICVTRSEFVNVRKCNVQKCGYECIGIVDSCDHCTVRDCYTQDGWRTCIQVHRGACNTVIENCYMKQTHTKYDACFTVHGLTGDDVVNNLRVINCTAECTQNGAQPYDYCAPYQIMSYSEKLSFIGNNAFGGKRAFYIQSSSTNAKIIGNDFQCNSSSDYGVTIGALNTIVVGNYLLNEASTPTNVIANNPVLSANVGIS